ncbi:Bug family tripartite tricarboxylate transporter substrate binding protein [Paracidovorax cattleyae]|uniref:Tripartite-type tricarboxylate transporter, receptor component TctC n=1 Tax=Paracidovorax cattleyae TaxID=80868 RepID=A0A1H0WAS3_9BURK|nr:tripartite tricarboxylate transporter substrate binding protein [Paracidovorax cattleyae]SDP87555.1 Tripartite-type tricarboxylate transporter, receptor component TctC [Paracidovorax cattleyae]
MTKQRAGAASIAAMPTLSRRDLLAAALLAAGGGAAQAQAWPERTVRVVVPYPAGGTSDQIARLLMARLSTSLGQSFFVDNKPGATGTLGALDVMRAPADGYTLMLTDNTFAITPSLFKKRKFDPVADFTPVTLVASTPVVLVVAQNAPYKTLADLVSASKKGSAPMPYGAGGYGGAVHLAFELLADQAQGNFVAVPYKGSGEVLAAVLSGTVQALISGMPSVAGQIKQGGLRPLAVSGTRRQPAIPNVPTFAEAGLPNYKVMPWFGVLGPRGLPDGVTAKLHDAITAELRKPDFRTAMDAIGAAPEGQGPAEFSRMLKDEVATWSSVARKAQIEPQ